MKELKMNHFRKKAFINFLELLIAQTYTLVDWQKFMVEHYKDETLENSRRSIATYFIKNEVQSPFSEETKIFLNQQLNFLKKG